MSSSRTKKSVINMGFNFMNQILMLILSFISRTVFIHILGVEYLGINGLFSDVLSLLSLADLGFNTAMVYSFYKPLAEKDYDKMAALTLFYRKVYNTIAFSVCTVGLALVPFIRQIVNLEKDVPNLEIYYLLSLVGIVVSYLCVYKTSVVTADQNNYIITRITIIINLVRTTIQILSLLLFRNYILYLIIGVICNVSNNLIASHTATKKYPFIKQKDLQLSKTEKKDIFNNIKSVFLYKVSSVLLNATDNILISTIVGTIVVGYYSNYSMITNKITTFYGLIFSSLTASVGNLIVKEKKEKRYEVFLCEQSVSFMISAIVIPSFAVLIDDLIIVWLGEGYVLDIGTVIAISLNMYLACVLQPLWSYREATGLYTKTKYVMLLCALTNVILSIILGLFMGITGIILASAISRIVTYVWYEPKVLFKEYFGMSPKSYFIDIIKNTVFIGVITTIIYMFNIYIKWNAYSWDKLFVKTIVVAIICIGVSFAIYSKSQGVKILIFKFKNIVGRKKN